MSADGDDEPPTRRQRLETKSAKSTSASSSEGPEPLLYLRFKNVTKGLQEEKLAVKRGNIVVFGRNLDLAGIPGRALLSNAADLQDIIPAHLQRIAVPVQCLESDDPAMGERHGLIWATENGVCFMRALNNKDGVCKSGIRVRLDKTRDKEFRFAFGKGLPVTDLTSDWRMPAFLDAFGADVNKSRFRILVSARAAREACIRHAARAADLNAPLLPWLALPTARAPPSKLVPGRSTGSVGRLPASYFASAARRRCLHCPPPTRRLSTSLAGASGAQTR